MRNFQRNRVNGLYSLSQDNRLKWFKPIRLTSLLLLLGLMFVLLYLSHLYVSFFVPHPWDIPKKLLGYKADSGPDRFKPDRSNYHDRLLGYYYTYTSAESVIMQGRVTIRLDSEGIRVVDYGDDIGVQYNPVTISFYALGLFERWLAEKRLEDKQAFIKQVDWLLANMRMDDRGFGVWLFEFNDKKYHLEPPWVSALGQGLAISALLRAYQLTENNDYFKAAEKAIKAFDFRTSDGGVITVDRKGFVWYQEYPSTPPSYVLNGFIASLFGIYDFYRVTEDKAALERFNKGISTLENYLGFYDTGFWSTYDLVIHCNGKLIDLTSAEFSRSEAYDILPELASKSYHNLHISQIGQLYNITSKEIFRVYFEKWTYYRDNLLSHANFLWKIILNKLSIKSTCS